jgi:hypothetical protein
MTQHLKHLRDALLPVHESSYVPSRAERVTVDRRDLRALLADYDALYGDLQVTRDHLIALGGKP